MTTGDLADDLDLIQRALERSRMYVSGHDQAESVRSGKDAVAYSALRAMIEQAEKAAGRIVARLTPAPGVEPCYLPAGRDGGGI